jgi:hypothetical protein
MKKALSLIIVFVTLLSLCACSGGDTQSTNPPKSNQSITYATDPNGTTNPAPTTASTTPPTAAPTQAPTEAPTQAPTQAPTEAPTQAPTEKPTTKPITEPTEKPTEPVVSNPNYSQITYVLNTKSHKFHKTTCHKLPTDNRQDTNLSRSEIIGQGYEPCKLCHP